MALKSWGGDDDLQVHSDLLGYVSDLLTEWHWQVRRDPQIGTARPDLVAEAPDGSAYVIELKTGPDAGHLGTIGQIEAFQNALQSELGEKPTAVLLLADDAPEKLLRVAEDVGVTLLGGFHNEPPALESLLVGALLSPESDERTDDNS